MPVLTHLLILTQLTRQTEPSEDFLAGPPIEFVTQDGVYFLTADGVYFGTLETTVVIIQPIVLTSPAGVPFVTQSGALLVRGTRKVTPQE